MRMVAVQEAKLGKEDRDGFGGLIERSASNAYGNAMQCVLSIIIII